MAQLLEWTGVLGSAGGTESMSTPFGLAVLLTPSLLLGASLLVLMVCVHRWAPFEPNVWSQTGLAFATACAVLISLVYDVQLTFVGPRLASGDLERAEPFLFVPFDSFLYSLDLLGYTFMSVATLFSAFAFTGEGIERTVRRRPSSQPPDHPFPVQAVGDRVQGSVLELEVPPLTSSTSTAIW